MPIFAYKGRSARGDLVQGTLEGTDSAAIIDYLRSTGITPVDIRPSQKMEVTEVQAGAQGTWWQRLSEKPVGLQDLMLFSRQMHVLLKAGVPIMRALAGLQESTKNPAFAAMLQDLRENLDSGRELSFAMRRHPSIFSPFYISMIQVGEMTGMLDETFNRLYTHLEFEKHMRENIRSALRYPSFVVLAMVAAIVVVNIFVIPSFVKVFEGFHSELPLMTRFLMASSSFFVHFWPLLLLLCAVAVMAFRAYTRTAAGKYQWDRYKLGIPIAGKIILKSTLARFARSLALGMRSGIPIMQALSAVAAVVDNEFMRARVEQMREGGERGESILQTAVATGVFNPVVLQMIAVGEETGELDALMFEVAGMYEQEVESVVSG